MWGRRIAPCPLNLGDGTRFKADLQDLLGLDDHRLGDLLALLQVLHARNLPLDCLITSHPLLVVMRMWGDPPAS